MAWGWNMILPPAETIINLPWRKSAPPCPAQAFNQLYLWAALQVECKMSLWAKHPSLLPTSAKWSKQRSHQPGEFLKPVITAQPGEHGLCRERRFVQNKEKMPSVLSRKEKEGEENQTEKPHNPLITEAKTPKGDSHPLSLQITVWSRKTLNAEKAA